MTESTIQRSLAGGEIAPALYGRADQAKYQTGLKTCRNFEVLKHGGIANRTGSKFTNEVKDSSVLTYFIKFVYNDDQTYVIEVGNLYMRFFRNGARIVVSGVTAWSNATAYVIGDLASRLGVNYYCILAHTNQQPPNATYWYPLTGVIYEIPTPYVTADIARLKYVQDGDVVTITHPSYDERELARTGHTAWTLSLITFAPSIAAPAGLTSPDVGVGGDKYVVTSIKTETFEESLPTAPVETTTAASSGTPDTLSWTAVSGAQEYNVYKLKNGVYGFIGVAGTNAFTDNGIVADTSISPPITRDPFVGANTRPDNASYYQQRRVFANTNNEPTKVWTTRTGMTKNMTISSPLQDDDAVTFSIRGRKVAEVRHMFEIGEFVILTSSGEWVVLGDADGVLRANQPPNLKQIGNNGASDVMPVIVDDSLIFLQARGSVLRDLKYQVSTSGGSTGYQGRDLTVFAGHLFRKRTITRMDYAQTPDSIVKAIRSDGVMLGLTYLKEHEVWGWHRHDTDGDYEDVCVVPEGEEDATYVMVKRTINGSTKRYIERFASRFNEATDDIVDAALYLDSFLTYDGRNTGATTVTLSTGAGWTVDDIITVTAALGTPFVAGDVGNDIVVWLITNEGEEDETRTEVKIRVSAYTSTTVVSGMPNKTVPATLRATALTTWGRAVDDITGLGHLEAKNVGVFADGHVVANPNNDDYTVVTVASAAIHLDKPYLVIHVGLPYLSDMQTLDLDSLQQSIRDRKKLVTHIALLVESSRGIFAGPDFDTLDELQPEPITSYGEPVPLKTGIVEMPIASTWQESGSFCVRQKDPLPLTILSTIPSGQMGG